MPVVMLENYIRINLADIDPSANSTLRFRLALLIDFLEQVAEQYLLELNAFLVFF